MRAAWAVFALMILVALETVGLFYLWLTRLERDMRIRALEDENALWGRTARALGWSHRTDAEGES